ncbi:hypothetical protein [Paraburkholderia gardini]|uniref:hypothetical protein n=1 Tax=Paraburkholderia gardini TaxID=2823469 RepID=UPI001D3A0BA8|nr:hypothetical protein [Paraburkholderia gardini]CAG4891662.1 hypothetical protein R69919_01227 [Paraburkholderia gardini]
MKARTFFIGFCLPLVLFIAAIFLSFAAGIRIPGPRISASEAFNEKAAWLRTQLAPSKCDVLVIGSSVALNDVDNQELAQSLHTSNIINAASWGLNIEDLPAFYSHLSQHCKFRTVILATTYIDFESHWDKEIDWQAFEHYLSGAQLQPYVQTPDLYYYTRRITSGWRDRDHPGNVDSLDFDHGGSVLLACGKLDLPDERVYAWRTHGITSPRPGTYVALAKLAAQIRSDGARFIIVSTPVAAAARNHFGAALPGFWQPIEGFVHAQGVEFIYGQTKLTLNDSSFADFLHLNRCGAGQFTRWFARSLNAV